MTVRSHDEARDGAGTPLSDEQVDALVRTALEARHMPEGLAASTLAFVHERGTGASAEQAAPAVDERRAAQSAPDAGAPLSFARRRMPRRRFVQLMAACLATGALAAGGVGAALADETAQVQVDGSATVELGLNRWERVVRTWASDDALAAAVDALGLTRLPCAEALELLASDAGVMGALSRDGHVALFASSDNEGRAASALAACEASAGCFGTGTACATVDAQTRDDAHNAGMGVARYLVYLEIAALDPSVSLDDCRGLSMRELREMLAGLSGETGSSARETAGNGRGSGQHGGSGGKGNGQGRGATGSDGTPA